MLDLSRAAGQWQRALAPNQPQGHESKQLVLDRVLCHQCFLDIVYIYIFLSQNVYKSPVCVSCF